jgi:NADH-quinone oxidoreductase subunit J
VSFVQLIFYILAAGILVTGFLAVTTRKIFRSAIWLLFSLIGVAGIYFLLEVEFIAAVQIIVYVGGIVVLIIFSIFLTQQAGKEMAKPRLMRTIFSIGAALFGFGFTYYMIANNPFPSPSANPLDNSVSNIGTQLMNVDQKGYALPFEVVSVLLLAAMIGCIVIAIKSKPEQQ